jgi:hypothetical protein
MSETLSFSDETTLTLKRPPWADWKLDIHQEADPVRDVAHAVGPGAEHSIVVHQRDCLCRRREIGSRPGERLARYQRHKLKEIEVKSRGYPQFVFDTGHRYGAKGVLAILHSSDQTWQRYAERKNDSSGPVWRQWESVREQSNMPTPPSCSALDLKQVSGAGSRTRINEFLEGGSEGLVDHSLGGVHVWKAAFVAEYQGETIAALVLSTPASPHADPNEELVISRLACHPVRPPNTSSWFIARARDWARERGYQRLVAFAGVGGNDGTCYEAAGFSHQETVWADGSGWTNRDGRQEVVNGRRWRRSKWVYDLG